MLSNLIYNLSFAVFALVLCKYETNRMPDLSSNYLGTIYHYETITFQYTISVVHLVNYFNELYGNSTTNNDK